MTTKLFYSSLLLIFHTGVFGQISIDKIRKPNLTDPFEKNVFEINKELDSSIFNTQIWISDEYDNRYDFDYGIIINKKHIQDKLAKFNNVDLKFLLQLIIAHEKNHAKYYSRFEDKWKREYAGRMHIEQLKLDEIRADVTAGYYAFDYFKSGYVIYILNILKQIQKNGFEKEPSLTSNELDLSKKMRANEINALKLFAELGQNTNQASRYPNSYQRMSALEFGMKAASIREYSLYLKNPKNNLNNSEKQLLIGLINASQSEIDYANYKYLNEQDYFYNDYLEKVSHKISHILSQYSKYITIQLLDGKDSNESGFSKFRISITNSNVNDSLRVYYSVLLCGKPNSTTELEYPNYTTVSATHSNVVVAPKETKIVTDSLLDVTEPLEGHAKFKIIFPGQFGSLYYTELVNQKNAPKYYVGNILADNDCDKCTGSLDELLNELYQIQNDFRTNDIDDYINAIGFKNINTDYVEYSTFIKNRPFELLVGLDKSVPVLKTIVYRSENINMAKTVLKSILKTLSQKNLKVILEDDKAIYLKSDMNIPIGIFQIVYDDIFSEHQIELKLIK